MRTENVEVTRKYQEASERVDTLSQRNERLREKVTRAAQLETRNIVVELQSRTGKKTTKVNRADIIKFSFVVSKNITASVGDKIVYIRIVNPNGEVLFVAGRGTNGLWLNLNEATRLVSFCFNFYGFIKFDRFWA